METGKRNKIIFFVCLMILGVVLIYIGLTMETPESIPKEGTICTSDGGCVPNAPDYIPNEIKQEIEEVIK
ncbi:hypothetical protein KY343_05800 [Candidatus Woesearchaeota archaeon]|nr:hypothetical protein [Candidatus Woesearchaeota archaeon]